MSEVQLKKKKEELEEEHPMEHLLRMERMPHIWCPTCGIGTAVTAFLMALEKSQIPLKDTAIVSGIGCTGRVAGYIKLDSFHSTHGRAIPFATGLKLANRKTESGGFLRGWGYHGNRRESLFACGKKKYGFDRRMRQQLHLRHDRRTVRSHHAGYSQHLDFPLWEF